jgi:hypothetical protein
MDSLKNLAAAGAAFAILLLPSGLMRGDQGSPVIPNSVSFPNAAGSVRTVSMNGGIDLTQPFFQSLGTNGRSCGTCHQPSDAMSVSASHVELRFRLSQGMDPIFRTNDGSNCDHDIDISTLEGRRQAYSLLRTRGLIRIALDVPESRDFEVMSVSNPYGCNETGTLSLYRRPLPTANLKFLTTVMWDGRESSAQAGTTPISGANYPQALHEDLTHQAVEAINRHAQGPPPGVTSDQQRDIVAFEMGLFTAQAEVRGMGALSTQGAQGGPEAIAQQNFFVGINDPVGLDPTNPVPLQFNRKVFNLFDAWENAGDARRAAIARGQEIFNTKTFTVTGVPGLNGNAFSNGVTAPDTLVTTCGVCHDTPNAGGHSVAAPLNIGVADPPGGNNTLDTGYLPVITICQLPALTTCVTTTDPGRAMITGKFADVGKFKGPILRGLAARAPYFHNGSARTLEDAVEFYDNRFHINLTGQEKSDLVAFLKAL